MRISWELTARSFFDQLSTREQSLIEQSVRHLAANWKELGREKTPGLPSLGAKPGSTLESMHIRELKGLSSENGYRVLELKVGDLRVLVYRRSQSVVVMDILRQSQIERLRSA